MVVRGGVEPPTFRFSGWRVDPIAMTTDEHTGMGWR
jgi:hypothetical protein